MKKRKANKARAGLIDSARAFLSHPGTLAACKIFIGALFIISSVTKIPEPARFADSIANYKILPDFLLMPMAYTVPWIQLIAGVCIILDIYAQSSAFILCGLLVVYIAAITSAFVRGFEIECGCFDLLSQVGLEDKVGITAIVRDTIFLLFPGNVFIFDKNGFNFYGLLRLFKKK
jgi:putative oxidoreductase